MGHGPGCRQRGMVGPSDRVPDRGDVVWVSFSPQAGREQAGRRPALVLSAAAYNVRVGLALCCPITRQAKGYPFEVLVPAGLDVQGVVLADQIKNLDWRARRASFICRFPASATHEVLRKTQALL